MTECQVKNVVVSGLHPFRDDIASCSDLIRFDDVNFKEGNHRHGKEERYHQIDGDGPREVFKTIVEYSLHGQKEWEEDSTDADCGKHHRHKILAGRFDGSIIRFKSFTKVFQITVDDYNAVIHYHSQDNNECRQRDDVQFDAHHIHDGNADKGAQRNGDGCHDGRTDGKQHHHDKDDDDHRDDEVTKK